MTWQTVKKGDKDDGFGPFKAKAPVSYGRCHCSCHFMHAARCRSWAWRLGVLLRIQFEDAVYEHDARASSRTEVLIGH